LIDNPFDYYRILGLNCISNESEIKKAYYKIAKETHPDILKYGTDKMVLVNEAYAVLSDQSLKKDIDRKILNDGKNKIVSILKDCKFFASSSAIGFNPGGIVEQGWLSQKASNWFIFELKHPAFFSEISAEALNISYNIKRQNLDFVEIYRLYGIRDKESFLINEFKLLSSGDRDIFFKSEFVMGPFKKLKLETVKAPSPIGWKSLRIYGYYS